MRLEDITAELRPRNTWEAADLGTALVRRDFGAVMLRQAVVIFPIWILLGALLFSHPGWILFFLWWLKPLYERVSLFYVSRRLFGARPTLGETVKAAPGLLFQGLLMSLVGSRLSLSRSAFQPVMLLEGLRWGAYARRVKVLRRYANGGWVTVMALFLELGLMLSLAGLVALLLPFSSGFDGVDLLVSVYQGEVGELPTGVYWQFAGLYAASVFLLAPFYSGAGFAIYINARTLLEGWDIELALRRISHRLAAGVEEGGAVNRGKGAVAAVGILAMLGFFWASAGQAGAELDPKEEIAEVLKDPDFEIHKVEVRAENGEGSEVERTDSPGKYRGNPSDPGGGYSGGGAGGGGGFSSVILYGLAIAGVGMLVWWMFANRQMFSAGAGRGEAKKVRTVMGMEVGAESLPDDVPTAAAAAWEAGDGRLALGLLYRGAICWLVECGNVRIRESDTEHECLERAGYMLREGDEGRRAVFEELTGHWILVAYAGRPPSEEAFRTICRGWPFGLDQRRASPAPAVRKLQQRQPPVPA